MPFTRHSRHRDTRPRQLSPIGRSPFPLDRCLLRLPGRYPPGFLLDLVSHFPVKRGRAHLTLCSVRFDHLQYPELRPKSLLRHLRPRQRYRLRRPGYSHHHPGPPKLQLILSRQGLPLLPQPLLLFPAHPFRRALPPRARRPGSLQAHQLHRVLQEHVRLLANLPRGPSFRRDRI